MFLILPDLCQFVLVRQRLDGSYFEPLSYCVNKELVNFEARSQGGSSEWAL